MSDYLSGICDGHGATVLQPRPVAWFEPAVPAGAAEDGLQSPLIEDAGVPVEDRALHPIDTESAAEPAEPEAQRETSEPLPLLAGRWRVVDAGAPTIRDGVTPGAPFSSGQAVDSASPGPQSRTVRVLGAATASTMDGSRTGSKRPSEKETRQQPHTAQPPRPGTISDEPFDRRSDDRPLVPASSSERPYRRGRRDQELEQIRARLEEVEQGLLGPTPPGDRDDVPVERASEFTVRARQPHRMSRTEPSAAIDATADEVRRLHVREPGEDVDRSIPAPNAASSRRVVSQSPREALPSEVPPVIALPSPAPSTDLALPPVANRAADPPTSAAAPVVKISIGRIHVMSASRGGSRQGALSATRPEQRQSMSLEEYLRRRAAGRAG